MKSNEEVMADIRQNTQTILSKLEAVLPEKFTQPPLGGNWNVADVAEHLLLLDKEINTVLQGPAKLVDRDAAQKIDIVTSVFANMETKFVSPVFITPSGNAGNQRQLIDALKAERDKMLKTIAPFNLAETCTAFKHPGFGSFTRLEWVYFSILHANRHLQQIENMIYAAWFGAWQCFLQRK